MSHFLVIGLNTMGRTLARELVRRGAEVTAVDKDRDKTRRIMQDVDHVLAFDTTDRRALGSLPIHDFEQIVVCLGHAFEAAERTTLALEDFGAQSIINMATTGQRRDILLAIGADRVLTPGLLQARNLAVELTESLIDAFWFVNREQGLAELTLRTAVELRRDEVDRFFGDKVRFVGVRPPMEPDDDPRKGGPLFSMPSDLVLDAGQRLLLFGQPDDIARVARKRLGR
ncbi:MAG TPA: TrkA family potassium uptake protein [Planctomycetes bacterium]|nr:TrkA family potassium uptake protein [Planctomycetota bacterium]